MGLSPRRPHPYHRNSYSDRTAHRRDPDAVAQFGREVIGERTSAALAVRKEEGAQLGKPSAIPADVQTRILTAHRAGQTFSGIARTLDADAVPTPGGSPRWHHSVVAGVVHRAVTRTAVSA